VTTARRQILVGGGALYFSDWSIAPNSMGAGSVKRVILG
jgi:hypothetical protein